MQITQCVEKRRKMPCNDGIIAMLSSQNCKEHLTR